MKTADTHLDDATLEQLYVRLEGRIYNVVYRWVWNADDAQEIVQEAFVRLWKMRSRVRVATVEPLLYRIALNLAAKHRRRRKLWRFRPLEVLRRRSNDEPAHDETLARAEDHTLLHRAIETLPQALKETLLMCEFSELTYDEIGETLGIPSGTVGSRRNRALKLLREHLDQKHHTHERLVEAAGRG